ncbi:MAG: matrixin family metalloprotease [Planctomycetota bacterium]
MKLKHLFLPSLALGGAALLLGPAPTSEGFSLIGDSLNQSQRDFRVFNNFSKALTNDNQTPDNNFPGFQGAVMAIWKGCVEWGSELHGSGNGDPTQQGTLGSGGANFDPCFMGIASGVGGSGNNIHSQISGGSGGVLAFAEGGFSGAWRIRYYETWSWEDGPGSAGFNEIDLQGVAAHEYGHALGLGHSSVGGTTMFATASGTGTAQRSIEADDIAGVKAIYGTKSSTKPRINSISISGNTLTIQGEDFSSSGNQVWFTNDNTTSTGSDPFVKLTNLTSTGGGTQITVNIPGNAGPGDVFVRKNSTANSGLSNAWPFDPNGAPPPPTVTGITPTSVPAVSTEATVVTVQGNDLETVTGVQFDGNPVDFALTASQTITFTMPQPSKLGGVDITVDTPSGSGTGQIIVIANDPPVINNKTELVFAGIPADFTIGAMPGSIAALAGSLDQIPSILPGIVSADIGAGFTSINLIAAPVIDSTGSFDIQFNTAGLPPFTTLYFQVVVLDTSGTLPLPASNVVSVIIV